jgi:long-chain acyl-CoA synthetase
MSIHWPILRSLARNLRREMIVDDKRSYRGVDLLAGTAFVAAAVKPVCDTPTLGVLAPTSAAFPLCALAGWSLGKTVVPLNYLLKQDELQYVIDDCGTDTVVASRALLEHMGFTPRVRNLIVLEDLSFKGVPEPIWPAGAEDGDLGVILYTSGTSGRPKGVMLTHANIASNIRQIIDWVDIDKEFTFLGVLPQFHSFGMTALTLLPLTVGAKVVYTARFVPGKIVRLIREHRPTIFIAIPSMFGALLHAKDAKAEDFASVRFMVSGGEPLPRAVFDGFHERFGITINEGYGLTETSPVSNWCRPGEWREGSVGAALPGIEQRIVDPRGRVLGPHQDGEVQMRGPNVMRGYYKLPDETAKTFTSDGFFKTGDMGRLDGDGHLFITGRIKEMLIVGGENVFPREIEEVLNRHESVGASGVVGRMDPVRGEVPVAFVELKEGGGFDETALKQHCRKSLAGYKVPDTIVRLDALPRNPTGKVMRRELKKMLVAADAPAKKS